MSLPEIGHRFESLAKLAQAVTASLELPEVLDRVARASIELLPDSSSRIWVLEGDRLALRSEAGTLSPPRSGRKTEFDMGEGITGYVAVTRKPIVVEDVLADPRTINVDWMRQEGYVSFVGVPLLVRDQLVGVLSLLTRHRHPFSPKEMEILVSFGTQAAITIENARLFREARLYSERLKALEAVNRLISSSLRIEEVVENIAAAAARFFEAPEVHIWVADSSVQRLRRLLAVGDREFAEGDVQELAVGEGGVGWVAQHREPILWTDLQWDARVRRRSWALQHGLRYFTAYPIVLVDQVLGVIVMWRSAPYPVTPETQSLLSSLAAQAAIAIENARLYEERTRAYSELAAAQDQLLRTEKLRALGEMASGAAHNFNNLLTPILARAQLLLQEVEDPKLRRSLQAIERAALDGARTVRRIQEFTRIRRDRALEAVDLNEVVQQALEVTQPKWREELQSKGVVIQVVTSLASLPPVAGDPAELREALVNLILNAVDAMPGGGTLSLTTEVKGARVAVTVSDTGVGMSEEVQRRLFDPFFTTKGPRGTGLGLSMAYGIVSRHGGEIAVESAEGKGSTFRLSFPVSSAVPATPQPAPSPVGVPLRCLVVEDEPSVREVLGDLLEAGGHTAVVLGSGAEAIARFKTEPFDLVITDLAMPGLNGWEVARAVKEHDPAVPVFLVTGWGVEYSSEELKTRGVDRMLTKPLNLTDVLAAVSTCPSRRGGSEGC